MCKHLKRNYVVSTLHRGISFACVIGQLFSSWMLTDLHLTLWDLLIFISKSFLYIIASLTFSKNGAALNVTISMMKPESLLILLSFLSSERNCCSEYCVPLENIFILITNSVEGFCWFNLYELFHHTRTDVYVWVELSYMLWADSWVCFRVGGSLIR